jgi:type II secretory pathway pseudopilin PulG
MSHNNHNNPSCSHAEQMISYLYGEADEREKSTFETHLKTCSNCADELTGFGFVRSSVLDWRATDFSKLETPSFDVPAVKSEKSFLPVIVSTDSHSWFAGFKNLFSFNPALTTAALAILIVSVSAVLLAFNFSGKTDVARNQANKNTTQTVVSPTIETTRKPEEASVTNSASKEPLPASDANTTVPQLRQRERVVDKTAVKVSNNSPKNVAENSPGNVKNTDENIKKTTPVRKERVPNLNDIEEDEDKSIRLADLFEEIGTK